MIVLICLLITTAFGILVYTLLPRKHVVHSQLSQLAGVDSNFSARQIFEKIYSEKTRNKMQQQLQEAGWYRTTAAQMGLRTISYVVVTVAASIFFICGLHYTGLMKLVCCAFPIAGYFIPSQKLQSAIKKRKQAISNELPDFLDMLSSSVTAGIALNGALLTSVEMCQGPLGDELRATLADIRLGRSRAEALAAMATRVNQIDLSKLVTTVIQSERVGGNLSMVLEELAIEARERRLMAAEAYAGTLPVKLTIPMVFFLIPALLTVILGPVYVQASAAFGQ